MISELKKRAKYILTLAVLASSVILLIGINNRDQVLVVSGRTEAGVYKVTDITETEETVESAPIGVVKKYDFTLGNDLGNDVSLAFYTVHQYVTVWIDGVEVYRMEPAGDRRMTKTVGSNWTMIPLRSNDSGKNVCIKITPVYKSFRDRDVTFYIGSPLAIYQNRLVKDLPELILSGAALLTGVTFLCIAGYVFFSRKRKDGLASLGLFSIALGTWRLMDTRFTPFMDGGKPVLFYYIDVIMPMLGIIMLIQWIKRYFAENGRKILELYKTAVMILFLIQFILQYFGIADFRQLMITTHFAMGLGILCITFVTIRERKFAVKVADGKKTKMPAELLLALVCVAGIMLDVIAFYIKGNSAGLVFTLLTFLIYIVSMGVLSMQRYAKQREEIAMLDRKLTDSRIKGMMSQIRSHFIFNVLATISTYCKIDPKEADRALITFSRYLRRNINNIEEDGLIDFCVELDQVKDYVALEQLRFADRITFVTEIETTSFQIPPLTIQPIVENAIKHGIIETGKSGVISLLTKRNADSIEIIIKDDGIGFDIKKLEESESVGIRNVRYRVENMLDGTLLYSSIIGKGTTVVIKIPLQKDHQ